MTRPKKWFMQQKNMRGVLFALTPAFLWALYVFGWRVMVVVSLTMAAAILAEGLFLWRKGRPVSEAALVTGALLGLSLPQSLPLWMGPVGSVIAIVFGKMVFGGFGMNPFNPAMVGRAFIYLAFPLEMTTGWTAPLFGGIGALTRWSADAVTGPTPLVAVERSAPPAYSDLFLGLGAGCIGEVARVLLIIGGLYILWKKYARWRFVLPTFISAVVMGGLLWLFNTPNAPDPLYVALSGGLVFGGFFIVTDPISSPKTMPGAIVYGSLIGSVTVLVRVFGSFAEGFMFAVLLGNMIGPVIDWWVTDRKKPEDEI
jgi:Na+-transporting NADH:ubiquinone oxidoreductase subunit B